MNKPPTSPRPTLGVLPDDLMIHRLPAETSLASVLASLDDTKGAFFATAQSKDELSIVCAATLQLVAPHSSGPWRAIRVVGTLDFALTGILSGLVAPLAEAKISIFAISSYDTDYLLVNSKDLAQTIATLKHAGYTFVEPPVVEPPAEHAR